MKLLSSGLVTCNCKGFQFVNICKHSAAIAEKVLKILLSESKAPQRAKLQKQSGGGRKGHKDRRKREYSNASPTPSSKSSNSSSPFSEIWHNNEPLHICLTKDIPEGKVCGYCSKDFPRKALSIVPYDIALSHKERWQFLNRYRESTSDPVYIVAGNKMTTRYYCISKTCVLARFPYFCSDILKVPSPIQIKDSHKKLISDQLDIAL